MSKKAKIIFMIIGLGLLIMMFRVFGAEATIGHLKQTGWNFFWIVAINLPVNIFLSYAWMLMMPHSIKLSSFPKIVLARIAGDAPSSFNAIGGFAGEALKAMYLREILPFKQGLASVVLDRTIKTIALILIMLTGIIVSMFIINLPLYVNIISIMLSLGMLFFMLHLMKKQKNGFLEYIAGLFPDKIRNKIITGERLEHIKNIDNEIKSIFSKSERLRHFYIALCTHYTVLLVISTVEIYMIVVFANPGINLSILQAMFIYIVGFILTSAMFFMPANIGTSEGSYSLALFYLGFDPALGLSVGIIRRLRSFVWAGIGSLILFHAGLTTKEKK